MRKLILLIGAACMSLGLAWGQGGYDYKSGLKITLGEDHYIRFITWHQMWAQTNDLSDNSTDFDANFLLRRSRFLAYAQINKRFLILTHFGLNSLGSGQMGALSPSNDRDPNPVAGRGSNGQFFMHDAWVEYTIFPGKLYVGGGLHYWNGVSRLTNQSTLNFMTLDAPLFNWFSLGTSDQFARHLGVYAKGKIGRLDYRVAVNDGNDRPLFERPGGELRDSAVLQSRIDGPYTFYRTGANVGGKIIQGYFNYQFLDKESNTLPYFVGTYLGTKRVFNVGAGFYNQFNATATSNTPGGEVTSINNATTFGIDAFYDAPIGENGSAITAYGVLYIHDWGENYFGALRGVGTGNILYGKLGYLLPDFSKKVKIQPYLAYSRLDIDAWESLEDNTASELKIGANFFLDGHHAKFTAEYVTGNMGIGATVPAPLSRTSSQIRLQAMIWL